jgi:hypothetical protein
MDHEGPKAEVNDLQSIRIGIDAESSLQGDEISIGKGDP